MRFVSRFLETIPRKNFMLVEILFPGQFKEEAGSGMTEPQKLILPSSPRRPCSFPSGFANFV